MAQITDAAAANCVSGDDDASAGPSLRSPKRFRVEAGLAALSGFLFALTLVLPGWIEAVFGVDPDQHSGSLEWVITAAFGVMAVAAVVLARREWERRTFSLSARG